MVAGLPAAARAWHTLHALPDNTGQVAGIAVPGGWTPSLLCAREAERLVPDVSMMALDASSIAGVPWVSGGDVQIAPEDFNGVLHSKPEIAPAADVNQLNQSAREIIKATAKRGDGIVSRHINRPLSQMMSRILLRFPAARPLHATLFCALIGLAMLAALLLGGETGLMLGAVLFQCASVIDGVDGEMARATLRTSAAGAMWDTVTDACINLGFFAGVSFNLHQSGDFAAGIAGASACIIMIIGNLLLSRQAKRDGGDFTFNALKDRISQRPGPIRQWLIWITMRDFYALAACLLVLLGAASILLSLFAVIAAGWLAVMVWVMLGAPRSTHSAKSTGD